MDLTEKRGEIIKHLQDALTPADEIEDGDPVFLIWFCAIAQTTNQ